MSRIGWIGAGRMASAMVRGLLERGVYAPGAIACTGADDGTAEALAQATGIRQLPGPLELAAFADALVLAIKPQQLGSLPEALGEATSGRLVISILAGTPLERLQQRFPKARVLVRAMPNTPGQIGAGATAYAVLGSLAAEDRALIETLLGALGTVDAVDEAQLDAVTALSGSGPAYVFHFVAALRDAGIAQGLDPALAYKLALQTVRGASLLLEAVPETPEQHSAWVASPGGTTEAGLSVLHARAFAALIADVVAAAAERSRTLALEAD